MRPKPTIATCGGWITPSTDSAPRSPRLVAVTVGSDSSEPRSRPVRARCTRSRSDCISAGSDSVSASWIAGATSPPPRSAIAQPRCTRDDGRNAPSSTKPLSSGTARGAIAVALASSAAGSSRSAGSRVALKASSQAWAAPKSSVEPR